MFKPLLRTVPCLTAVGLLGACAGAPMPQPSASALAPIADMNDALTPRNEVARSKKLPAVPPLSESSPLLQLGLIKPVPRPDRKSLNATRNHQEEPSFGTLLAQIELPPARIETSEPIDSKMPLPVHKPERTPISASNTKTAPTKAPAPVASSTLADIERNSARNDSVNAQIALVSAPRKLEVTPRIAIDLAIDTTSDAEFAPLIALANDPHALTLVSRVTLTTQVGTFESSESELPQIALAEVGRHEVSTDTAPAPRAPEFATAEALAPVLPRPREERLAAAMRAKSRSASPEKAEGGPEFPFTLRR